MARSQTNTARIDGLRPGMVYVVQVRARTVAGYGKFSGKMCFQTLTDGKRPGGDLGTGQAVGRRRNPTPKKLYSQPNADLQLESPRLPPEGFASPEGCAWRLA